MSRWQVFVAPELTEGGAWIATELNDPEGFWTDVDYQQAARAFIGNDLLDSPAKTAGKINQASYPGAGFMGLE